LESGLIVARWATDRALAALDKAAHQRKARRSIPMKTRSGGCLCGAIRYVVRGEPYRFGICHCADCSKESGSVFVAYAHWRRDDAEVTGPVSTFRGRSFCPTCGSRLFNLHPADVEVRIGSFDEAPTTLGAPNREGWVTRRERWLHPVLGAEQNSQDPP
jgi:hypothetical protein